MSFLEPVCMILVSHIQTHKTKTQFQSIYLESIESTYYTSVHISTNRTPVCYIAHHMARQLHQWAPISTIHV